MPDREKVIKGLEHCGQPTECDGCPYDSDMGGCFTNLKADALALLKEQEPRELTKQEWEDWKKDSKRDPICFMYIGDGTPLWALKPEDINEVLYLTDKIKIYNKKPTEEQRKAVKWDE